MNFKKTKSDLDQLSRQQSITIADLFAVFRDLCSDAKDESGTPLSGLALGDRELLMKNIPWAGRLLLKYYDDESDPAALVKAKAEERRGQILALNQQCQQLEQELSQLSALAAQEEDKHQQARQLQAKIAEARQEAAQLSTCDLSQLAQALEAQQAQKTALEARITALRSQVDAAQAENRQLADSESQLRQQITQAQQDRSAAAADRDRQTALLEQTRAELTALRQEYAQELSRLDPLKQEIAAVRTQAEQSEQTIFQQQQSLSEEQEKLQHLQSAQQQLLLALADCRSQEQTRQQQLEALEEEKKQHLTAQQQLTARCLQLNDELHRQEAQLKKDTQTKQLLESNIEAMSAEIAQIMEQINTLRQNLKDGNQAEIRKNLLEEKRIQEEKLQQRYSIEEELTQLRAKGGVLEKRMQDMRRQISQLAEDNAALEQKISAARQEEDELSLKKQQLERSLKNIRDVLESGCIAKTRNTVELMQQAMTQYQRDCGLLAELYPDSTDLDKCYALDLQSMAERSARCIKLYCQIVKDFPGF